MAFIRRIWTAQDADEWSREDWMVIVISPICYVLLTVGLALSLLLQVSGYVMLAIGVIATAMMHYIIDPKLKAVSVEYERRQKKYLEQLEAQVRWKDADH